MNGCYKVEVVKSSGFVQDLSRFTAPHDSVRSEAGTYFDRITINQESYKTSIF